MKVRIRFAKTGVLIYIGHLDVMRYFQKLFRRAQIPVAYSEGFSPHQILSFTPPLPLGMESCGEYADVTLTEDISTAEALSRLRENSVEDISIMSFHELPDKCENAMASVRASGYSVRIDDVPSEDLAAGIQSLLSKDEIIVLKKTKKNEKYVNIRDLIYDLGLDRSGETVNMLISSGSTDNLKPQTVIEELLKECDLCDNGTKYDIKRTDQYTRINDKLVSLDEIGTDIP